jgi:hypothetical protein
MRTIRPLALVLTALVAVAAAMGAGCTKKDAAPRHRERDLGREKECRDPTRPRAFFYPAENRTHYKPDDPFKDGCEVLVPDHLFCCPDVHRPEDR